MSKYRASSKINFNPHLDLESSKARVGKFCEEYPVVGQLIFDLKEEIIQNPESNKYNNPNDYADFIIAEVLSLNVESTLRHGEKVYTRSSQEFDDLVTPSIKLAFEPLFEQIEIESKSSFNSRDLFMILALCYYDGVGVRKDEEAAADIFNILSAQSYAPALDKLARHYFKNNYRASKREATDLFFEASQQGYMPSRHMMGIIFYQHSDDAQRIRKSVECVQEAADAGYPPAQHDYAIFLHNGIGVTQDKEKAVRFFTAASDQGYPFDNFAKLPSAESETESDEESLSAIPVAEVKKKGERSAFSRFFGCFSSANSGGVAHAEADGDLLEQEMRLNPSAAFAPSKDSALDKLQSPRQGQKK